MVELHTSVLHCTLCLLIHLLDAGDSVLISYLIWMNLFLCFLFPILIEKICVFQTLKTVFAHISKHIGSLLKISLPVISKSGQHGRTCLIYHQCFRQTVPMQESHIAFREGPQKNGERANLALYFYKAACRLNPGIVF